MKSTNLDLERVLSPEPIIIANVTSKCKYNSNTIIILHLVYQNTYQVLHSIKGKTIKNMSKRHLYYKFKKGKMIKR